MSQKRIIICCDGTWNEPEQASENPEDKAEPTNVLKMVRTVSPNDTKGVSQVVYYDEGVGTAGLWDKYAGGGLGLGLSTHVKRAYRFVANNYADGDEIYLFGFSRGAYVARSLAGFIGAMGLLHKQHMNRLPEAYELYRTKPKKRPASKYRPIIEGLDPAPRSPVPVKFIGVWDTVGALGAPTPFLKRLSRSYVRFHDTELGRNVENAFHAIGVDERRRPFHPDLWTGEIGDKQIVYQVWFSGVHSNMGGGYKNRVLSDLTLFWMMECAEKFGLKFQDQAKARTPRPAEDGRVEDSFTFGYKAMKLFRVPKYLREIGPEQHGDIRKQDTVVPGERLASSAVRALGQKFKGNEGDEPYNPKNLAKSRGTLEIFDFAELDRQIQARDAAKEPGEPPDEIDTSLRA